MWIHSENWIHGKEDHFLEKYKDDTYRKELHYQDHKPISGENVSKEQLIGKHGLYKSSQSKSVCSGLHWTGYYKNETGYVDMEMSQIYTPKLVEILKLFNLYGKRRIYSFSSIWGQLSKKDVKGFMVDHDHYTEMGDMLSWVHFIKVPEQDCFFFRKGGEKIYPPCQRSGDFMVFPSYCFHGVDERINLDERFVIVGNIIRTK